MYIKTNMTKKILITGVAGFIDSHLTRKIIVLDDDVIIITITGPK